MNNVMTREYAIRHDADPTRREECVDVFIPIPQSNFDREDVLGNYPSAERDMVYASTDESVARRYLDDRDETIHIIEASLRLNNVGYAPLRSAEYDPTVDVYVDDVRRPSIFLIQHRDLVLKKGKIIEKSSVKN